MSFGVLDHGLAFQLGRRLSLWLMNWYSDAVICNSQAVAQHFSDGIPAAKQRVIGYHMKPPLESLQGEALPRRDNDSLNCVIVGEVAPHKHQEDAVVAVAQLAHAGLNVRLSIIGDGSHE